MKLAILSVLLLTGCAQMFPKEAPKATIDKIHDCMVNLIGRHGVEAKKAQKVCDKTFRGN